MQVPFPEGPHEISEGLSGLRRDGAADGRERGGDGGELKEAGEEKEEKGEGEHDGYGEGVDGFGRNWHGGSIPLLEREKTLE